MILRIPALLLVAAGMVAGDLVAVVEAAPAVAIAALVAALAALLVPWSSRRSLRVAAGLWLLSFGYACAAALGVYGGVSAPDDVARLRLPAKVTVFGRVAAEPDRRGATLRLLVDLDSVDTGSGRAKVSGRILLYVRQAGHPWAVGERLRAPVSLRHPRNFGNPGEFDYRAYLARRGVHVTGFAFDDSGFELLEAAPPGIAAPVSRWRDQLRQMFTRVLPGESGAVLRALILGEAGALPEDLRRAFARSGVRHVLTISGLHVGLVAAGSYSLLRWLLSRSRWLLLVGNVPKIAVVASIVPVVGYAQLAGGSLATTRAVVMALVFLGAVVVDRRRHLLVSLAAAAIALIIASPGATQEISFQLSFAAVLGLVVVLQRFWPWWLRHEEERLVRLRGPGARLCRPIAVYFVVSGAALAATMPLSAFYFNQVSIMALLANAVVVPLLGSIAVALGLAAAFLHALVPAIASALVWLAGVAISVGIAAVRLFAAVSFAAFSVVTPTKLELALLYGGMLAGLQLGGRRRMVALAAVAALLCVDAAWWVRERFHGDELRVTFLSVGQGDSAVVEFPGGEVMVVDAGGLMAQTFDVGERLIAPYLWSRRIATVDHLVVTHPQWDHYGGFNFLAEQFSPKELWSTGAQSSSAAYARLLERLRQAGARRRVLQRGDRMEIGGAEVSVDSPAAGTETFGINDRSLVLSLVYARRKVLLTGDIEAPSEAFLVGASGDDLRSTVIKVPHHGSGTSSTAAFVAAVQPRLAVVSAGFGNRYGFPAPQVLGRYAAVSSQVLRTDLDGAVEVRIDTHGTVRGRAWEHGGWRMLSAMRAP